MGIEPTLSAWEADVLPLNYTRKIEEILSVLKVSEKSLWRSVLPSIFWCNIRLGYRFKYSL